MDTTMPACLAGFADRVGGGRRHGHRLLEQPEVLRGHLERALHEGKVRVVRHDRLGKGRELHSSPAELGDLPHDLVDGPSRL